MDAIPPPYEYAIMKDALAIIAEYIPSADLCSASLVSRRWHAIFNPHLWGDPASHFGTQNDAVYGKITSPDTPLDIKLGKVLTEQVALTRFRRTLKHARLEVRKLTYTLHLPPALSEIYGGPRSEWLKELLDRLPLLQSLRVSKLPFFDHNATISLKIPPGQSQSQDYPPYSLRLLSAEWEPNATSIGLATALSRFPALVYLDLSYTSPARDQFLFSVLSELPDLRVLKLRGVGLKDADIQSLANAIGTRVRLLDIRSNLLTDTTVRSLLQVCFMPNEAAPDYENITCHHHASTLLRHPELDKKFFEFLTHPPTGRSIFDHLPQSGITHLYISDNRLTVEGVAALLASKRLHLLDAGSVDTAQFLKEDRPLLSPPGIKSDFNTVPGAEKLVPVLGAYAKHGLTHLRINHTVATKDAPAKHENSIIELLPELPADEPGTQHSYTELDTSHEIYELSAGNEVLFELEDTSVPSIAANLPEIVAKSDQYVDEPLPPRRASAFAAEAVNHENTSDERELTLDTYTPTKNGVAASNLRAEKILELLAKRPKFDKLPLRRGVSPTIPYLHPSHIPHVQTLILTDVPSHVQENSPILSSLIRFITECSDETLLAKLQAKADYSFPPGRDRMKAEQQHAKSLFALECLVLEITAVTRNTAPKALGAWRPQRYDDHASWKSTTGDVDSERLWSSAMDDFSFFGNEECGVPDSDEEIAQNILTKKVRLVPSDGDSIHSRYRGVSELEASAVPTSPRDDLCRQVQLGSTQFDSRKTASQLPSPPRSSDQMPGISSPTDIIDEPEVDLVSVLATFRRTKKREFEKLQKANEQQRKKVAPGSQGSSSSFPPVSPLFDSQSQNDHPARLPLHVEGYWPGEVKVIRNSSPKGRSGVVDIFGNYFEKGYLYP